MVTLKKLSEIQEAFKAMKVPVETEFCALIDLAGLGPTAGNGLGEVNGTLQVKPASPSGLAVTSDGLSIQCAKNGGLTVDQDRLRVVDGPGITIDTSGVKLKLAAPLADDTNVLRVQTGPGMAVDGAGLKLQVDNVTVVVKDNIVRVQCDPNGGLKIDESGHLVLDLGKLMPK